ncbi:uncharacterized protein LOC113559860 [Rhopalosiphum maidis]|uniref:uncharacterized protein LOC113559860 n=1 Tax=Rhopalosiphum maidis TaxID=43146 RepID=UPI000F002E20|nr:uncharacterized protein LOC113559860 [Rhopalosiphum maidis]
MNNPKGNNVHSKQLDFKTICLSFYLVIMMMEIGPCKSDENFTSIISGNGVSKTVQTFPITDLWAFDGIPNAVYHKIRKNCSKVNHFIVDMSFNDTKLYKPPPLIAALAGMSNKKGRGRLKGTHIWMNLTQPLKLILCDDNIDMLEWAKSSVLANKSSLPLNIDFSITYTGKRKTQLIKSVALEFASVLVIIFNNSPPECLLVDDSNHKLFWSDSKYGSIEAYDPKKKTVDHLVSLMTTPRSMVIDSTLELLFWCNTESVGSIERINFDGDNRMEITTGKYDLIYPDKLGIDHTNKMLYWMTDKVIHTSDYNGNSHKIIKKSAFYDPNIPRCISFTKATEYNFFWEKPRVPNHNRSFAPHLLSISYQKSGEPSKNTKFPSEFIFLELKINNYSTSHMCQKISSGYYCFLPPVPLNRFPNVKVNRMLSMAGYKPMKLNQLSKFHPKHEKLLLNVNSFYFNSKSRNVFYYDAETKNIRFISYLEEHPIDIVKNIISPINGFSYDGINNVMYFINASENSIIMTELEENNYPKKMVTTMKDTNETILVALTFDTVQNRLLVFASQYSKHNATYNAYYNEYVAVCFIRNLNIMSLPDLIVINSKTNIILLINTTDMSVEFYKSNNTDTSIIAYFTNSTAYQNNAQPQTLSLRRQILTTVLNIFMSYFTVHFACFNYLIFF